jgi:NADPH:quinone reductase-like Zn-dependent oxidoreductase
LRVLAANIGLPDRMMLEGRYFMAPKPPVTPGQEVVGIVEVAGAGYPDEIFLDAVGLHLKPRLTTERKAKARKKSTSKKTTARPRPKSAA